MLRFKLYIAGQTPRSIRAVMHMRRLGEELLSGEFCLDVVDVLEHPEAAEEERILATPTLVREAPLPSRRVTGDLSDPERIMVALALDPAVLNRPQEGRR